MSIDELYQVTRGSAESWGISEYTVPNTHGIYSSVSYGIPKETGKDFLSSVYNHAKKIPGVGRYEIKSNWNGPNGKMPSSPRNTHLDVIAKTEKERPGPASYIPKKV
jgi:hypothetical protein